MKAALILAAALFSVIASNASELAKALEPANAAEAAAKKSGRGRGDGRGVSGP